MEQTSLSVQADNSEHIHDDRSLILHKFYDEVWGRKEEIK